MKWENLSKLVDIVKSELYSYGHFIAELKSGFDKRSQLNNPDNTNIIST